MNEKKISKELSSYSDEVLASNLLLLKKEVFNLRFQKTLGELKNTSKFSQVKKNIARIHTEITKRLKIKD